MSIASLAGGQAIPPLQDLDAKDISGDSVFIRRQGIARLFLMGVVLNVMFCSAFCVHICLNLFHVCFPG